MVIIMVLASNTCITLEKLFSAQGKVWLKGVRSIGKGYKSCTYKGIRKWFFHTSICANFYTQIESPKISFNPPNTHSNGSINVFESLLNFHSLSLPKRHIFFSYLLKNNTPTFILSFFSITQTSIIPISHSMPHEQTSSDRESWELKG